MSNDNTKETMVDLQQHYFSLLGPKPWHLISLNGSRYLLLMKIAYGCFGAPRREPMKKDDLGYTEEEVKQITDIANTIIKQYQKSKSYNNNRLEIHFSCIFVVVVTSKDNIVCIDPVFKTMSSGNSTVFIDKFCRVYPSWQNYKKHNMFPSGLCCYPYDGRYQPIPGKDTKVWVEFEKSPASKVKRKICNVTDNVSLAAGCGSLCVGVAALLTFPVSAPIATAATVTGLVCSIYGASRNAYVLCDKASHSQSISLKDPSARWNWIALGSSVFEIGNFGAVSALCKASSGGKTASKISKFLYYLTSTGRIATNSVTLIVEFSELIKNKNPTGLDYFKFTASVFFFCNDVIKTKSAKTLINDIRKLQIPEEEEASLIQNYKQKCFNNINEPCHPQEINLPNDVKKMGVLKLKNGCFIYQSVLPNKDVTEFFIYEKLDSEENVEAMTKEEKLATKKNVGNSKEKEE